MGKEEKTNKALENVVDEKTFIEFLAALHEDWVDSRTQEEKYSSSPYSVSANGWENGSLEAFLEAASAGGSDHLTSDDAPAEINPWQRAAFIISLGKYYE